MRIILCLETEWGLSGSKMDDKASVKPLLDFLRDSIDYVDYDYRTVATKEDLRYYLKYLNLKKHNDVEILYLAFHGQKNIISLSSGDDVDLHELGDMCSKFQPGKFIHFGSCRTFITSDKRIQEFKERSHAKYVSGYTTTTDFIDGSILDVAYFSHILRTDRKFATLENQMQTKHGELCKQLGFKII